MEVAIIGGGIAGLTTALCLHQQGLTCRVYEAVPEFKPLGVGINLLPHAIRRLGELGLTEDLAKVGVEPKEFCFFNSHGQLIYREPCGRGAGYQWPHFSLHRADLHQVLLTAVMERIGPDSVVNGWRCNRVEQDEDGVTIHFDDQFGEPLPSVRASVAIGCDGLHSTVRKQFYPDEGEPVFGGIMLWRGMLPHEPILSGASIVRAGPVTTGKFLVYSIRNHDDGTQLFNWAVEITRPMAPVSTNLARPSAWRPGNIDDFIGIFESWKFDWLDVPGLIRATDPIFEHPMVDRDPLPRWTFGRVTLLGDAAHPMYPRGGNGGAQAILDAHTIAPLLKSMRPEEALAAYEDERREFTSKIILTNRTQPPDYLIETVEERTGGKPFHRLEDVIPEAEMVGILERYKRLAAYDIKSVNG